MAASSSTDVDEDLWDEICAKSPLLNNTFVIDEDDDKRGVQGLHTSKKTLNDQVKATPSNEVVSKEENDELVNITDGAFETILKEASTPLYSKSSKNALLQKVINETNFDEPYLASGAGKFPPCYKESRRHLERRLRQDYESTVASRTTQGGSLQNLYRKSDSGKKVLRKSGSLNAFPAGLDDSPELAALKSLLAASSSSSAAAANFDPPKERFLVPLSHLLDHGVVGKSNDDEDPTRCAVVGKHRRNRSMSECLGVVRDLAEADEESVTLIVDDDDGEQKNLVAGRETNDATILNCVKATSESDETEEVEMMDVDHSSEETKSCETSPLLRGDASNGEQWSSSSSSRQLNSCVEQGFAEVTTTRCFSRVLEADDKVDFPLMTQSCGEYQQNGQSLTEIGFGGVRGSRKDMVLTNHRQTVARLVGGSEGENHITSSESHIYDRKKPENDLKLCGLQRPLDENGNPLIYHEGLGTYRSTAACFPSQFPHHREAEVNFGSEANPRMRKQKKARQNSKQKVIKAEQIDGHFGDIKDIEEIMKRINSEDEENVVSNDSRPKRISQKDGNRHIVTKVKKPLSGNKDNNKKNLENRIDLDPTANGTRSDSSSLPVDGDDAGSHQERSNVRSKQSKVRKQEFQKRSGGGAGGVNGSSDGGSSNKASFEGDSVGNPTKSPERITVDSSTDDTKPEEATVEETDVVVVVDKVSSFVADFYSVTELPSAVDEREFHEVRKKKKKKKQKQQTSNFQVTKGDGGRYSHRVRDQGGGSFGNAVSSGGRVGEGGVLWPDLSSLSCRHRGQLNADDVRRKSAGSVPPSEHSSEDTSDVESVHSLPVSSTSPKTAVGKTSSSSSCTPQASYADIARMSAAPVINPRGNFLLSASSVSSFAHCETKRDAFTSTSVDKNLLSPRSADERPSMSEPSLSDTGESQCAFEEECVNVPDDNALPKLVVVSASPLLVSTTTGVLFSCGTDVAAACERTTERNAQGSKVSQLLARGSMTVVDSVGDSFVEAKDTTVAKPSQSHRSTDDVVVSLPPAASRIATNSRGKVAKLTKSTQSMCNSKSRPVVIFADDLGSPAELNEVTFGFEVNEQLLRESAAERTVVASFATGDVVPTPVTFGTVVTMPSTVDRARHRPLTTCSEDDDSIIASGSITSFHPYDRSPISERTFSLGAIAIGDVCEASTSEMHNFNYDNVVDYIGLAWNGVQKELEIEAERSCSNVSADRSLTKIQYYKRVE